MLSLRKALERDVAAAAEFHGVGGAAMDVEKDADGGDDDDDDAADDDDDDAEMEEGEEEEKKKPGAGGPKHQRTPLAAVLRRWGSWLKMVRAEGDGRLKTAHVAAEGRFMSSR